MNYSITMRVRSSASVGELVASDVAEEMTRENRLTRNRPKRMNEWIVTVMPLKFSNLFPSRGSCQGLANPAVRVDIHHLRSTTPDRTPNHHPSRTTSRLRTERGVPTPEGIRPIPSYFEPLGTADANFVRMMGGVLCAIERRDGYATTRRNEMTMMTADGAEPHSNNPT